MPPINIVVFSFDLPENPCAYIRLLSPFEAVKDRVNYALGVSVNKNLLFKRIVIHDKYIDFADLIIVQRTFPRAKTSKILKKILSSGKPVIYDTDDLLTDLPQGHVSKAFIDKKKPFIVEFMKQVDMVSVSTPLLAEALQPYNNKIQVLHNLVDDSLWHGRPSKIRDKVVIGFGGTKSHYDDIKLIEEALLAIADKYRETITFKFFGSVPERMANLPCVEYIEFNPTYVEYAESFKKAGIDVAIVPLADNRFNRCKSNIKWLEYSMCGIAGIYADLPPYNTCIESGKTGLLAGSSVSEWYKAIELLIINQELRHTIGNAAHQEVLANYSLGKRAHIYYDFWRQVIQEKCQAKDTDNEN